MFQQVLAMRKLQERFEIHINAKLLYVGGGGTGKVYDLITFL